jgi:alpha-L-glutamate ligase-like protein
MAKLSDILGINARSGVYLRHNLKRARKIADNKLLTKKILSKARIPHPRLLAKLATRKAVERFDWLKLSGSFVIKPVAGLGGQGVLVVRKKLTDKDTWVLAGGKMVGERDLTLHSLDIIEGRYSRNDLPDAAMVEERVKIHPKFRKLAVGGTPDVRVIVHNKIPVMAMLRLPTEESGGKANLHQGAIGLGVDMATGITTYGVCKDNPIRFFPDTNRKVNGIAIPDWGKILKLAVETQIASKLSFLSVDFLIDEERGPLVLELNDQPGLSIQLANHAGLRKRLERIEGLDIETVDQGVNVARTLFASKFAGRVKRTLEGLVVVRNLETIQVLDHNKKKVTALAKLDTGAYSTSIDKQFAQELGLLSADNILWEKEFKSALGKETRKLIRLVYWLGGRKVVSRAGLSDRKQLRRKILIGRRDLRGFLIDPVRYEFDNKLNNPSKSPLRKGRSIQK